MAKCIKHRMPDGKVMNGPVHGPGQTCIEWDNMKKGGRTSRSKQHSTGGYLVGPSHEEGGIQAIVDGTEPIEVEGGEFVINKQTVDAVGENFLHKLNSTQTTHHTGGFESGQLPNPSKFKDGGKIGKRTTPVPTKKLQEGGNINNILTGRAVRKTTSPKHYGINKNCRHLTSKYDCNRIRGCSWDDGWNDCK